MPCLKFEYAVSWNFLNDDLEVKLIWKCPLFRGDSTELWAEFSSQPISLGSRRVGLLLINKSNHTRLLNENVEFVTNSKEGFWRVLSNEVRHEF